MLLLQNFVQGPVNRLPLNQQLSQHLFSLSGQAVEAFVALVLFAPHAGQQTLNLQPAQQWVKRVLVDLQPVVTESLAQRIAVSLAPQGRKHGKNQRTSTQFQPEIFKEIGNH